MQPTKEEKVKDETFQYSLTEYRDVNLDQRHKRIKEKQGWRPGSYDEYPEF